MKYHSLLFRTAMLLFAFCVIADIYAYDFMADDIYYTIIDGNQVHVTYKNQYEGDYSGKVTIPENVTFNNTSYMVTGIGYWSFYNSKNLTHIDIPNSVRIIEEMAFAYCTQLETLVLDDSLEVIDSDAFYQCKKLRNIYFPENLKIINGYFPHCGTPWYDNLPDGMIYIGRVALFYKGTMPSNTHLNIKDGTYSISDYAFKENGGYDHDCTGLTGITIPNSVKIIGHSAFNGCIGLTEIEIPNSVKIIGESAFENCPELTTIIIGNGIDIIEADAFYECPKLVSITCLAATPPAIEHPDRDWDGYECFEDATYANAILYVPKGAEAVYRLTDKWKKFTHIVGIDVNVDACDVNGDGVVNISDLNNVINDILAGKGTPSMDINGDGSVNISDINTIIQTILTAN